MSGPIVIRRGCTIGYLCHTCEECGRDVVVRCQGLLTFGPGVRIEDEKALRRSVFKKCTRPGLCDWHDLPISGSREFTLLRDALDEFFWNSRLMFNVILRNDQTLSPWDFHDLSTTMHLIRARMLRFPGESRQQIIRRWREDWEGGTPDSNEMRRDLGRLQTTLPNPDLREGVVVKCRLGTADSFPLMKFGRLMVEAVNSVVKGLPRTSTQDALVAEIALRLGRSPGAATAPNERKWNVWRFAAGALVPKPAKNHSPFFFASEAGAVAAEWRRPA